LKAILIYGVNRAWLDENRPATREIVC